MGCIVGCPDGRIVGWPEGRIVGCSVGCDVGWAVGCFEGWPAGLPAGGVCCWVVSLVERKVKMWESKRFDVLVACVVGYWESR